MPKKESTKAPKPRPLNPKQTPKPRPLHPKHRGGAK